jgi:hypothetical protein
VDQADHDRVGGATLADRGDVPYLHMHALVVLVGQPGGGGASDSVVGDEMIVAASTTRGSLGV